MTPVQPQPMLLIPASFQVTVADITVAICSQYSEKMNYIYDKAFHQEMFTCF